jgi:hypothetical protein
MGANILNRSTDSGYLGGDGVSLLSTAHPLLGGGTFSNTLATPADLSETALEDIAIMIRTAVDDRNLPIALRPKKLVIPPHLEYVAARLLRSNLRPGTGDNDTNAIRTLGTFPEEPAVITRLTDQDRWFIKTDCMDGLKRFNRKKLEKGMDTDFNTGNAVYKARTRFSYGWSDPRGMFGSSGA